MASERSCLVSWLVWVVILEKCDARTRTKKFCRVMLLMLLLLLLGSASAARDDDLTSSTIKKFIFDSGARASFLKFYAFMDAATRPFTSLSIFLLSVREVLRGQLLQEPDDLPMCVQQLAWLAQEWCNMAPNDLPRLCATHCPAVKRCNNGCWR